MERALWISYNLVDLGAQGLGSQPYLPHGSAPERNVVVPSVSWENARWPGLRI